MNSIVTSLITVVPAVALCSGIIYDWAFYNYIAPELFTLTTPQDHLNSALLWLPITIGIWVVQNFIPYARVKFPFSPQVPGESDAAFSKRKAKYDKRLAWTIIIGMGSLIIPTLYSAMHNILPLKKVDLTLLYFASAFTIWLGVIGKIRLHQSHLQLSLLAVNTIQLTSFVGIMIALAGYQRAAGITTGSHYKASVDLEDNNSKYTLSELAIIANISRGMLVVSKDKQMIFFPNERIVSIRYQIE